MKHTITEKTGIEEEAESFKDYLKGPAGLSEGTADMYSAYIKRLPEPINFNTQDAGEIKSKLTAHTTTSEVRSAFKKYLKYLKHENDYTEETSRDIKWVVWELDDLELNRDSSINKSEVLSKYLKRNQIQGIVNYVIHDLDTTNFSSNQRWYDEFRLMPLLMFETGCRISELIGKQYDPDNTGLRRSDVDFDENQINIRKAKRGKQRFTDFKDSESILQQLLEKYEIEGKIFEIPYWKARDELAKIGAALFNYTGPYDSLDDGDQRLTSHWFRHSFATNWVIKRVDEGHNWAEAKEMVNNYLDHEDMKTTEAYIEAAKEISRGNIYEEHGSFNIDLNQSEQT